MSSSTLSPVGESFGGWDPSSIFGGGGGGGEVEEDAHHSSSSNGMEGEEEVDGVDDANVTSPGAIDGDVSSSAHSPTNTTAAVAPTTTTETTTITMDVHNEPESPPPSDSLDVAAWKAAASEDKSSVAATDDTTTTTTTSIRDDAAPVVLDTQEPDASVIEVSPLVAISPVPTITDAPGSAVPSPSSSSSIPADANLQDSLEVPKKPAVTPTVDKAVAVVAPTDRPTLASESTTSSEDIAPVDGDINTTSATEDHVEVDGSSATASQQPNSSAEELESANVALLSLVSPTTSSIPPEPFQSQPGDTLAARSPPKANNISQCDNIMAVSIQRVCRGYLGRRIATRRMLQVERDKLRIRQSSRSSSRGNASIPANGTIGKEKQDLSGDTTENAVLSDPTPSGEAHMAEASMDSNKIDGSLMELDANRQSIDSLGAPSPDRRGSRGDIVAGVEGDSFHGGADTEAPVCDMMVNVDEEVSMLEDDEQEGIVGMLEQRSVASITTVGDAESVDMEAETPSSKEVVVYKALRQPTSTVSTEGSAVSSKDDTSRPTGNYSSSSEARSNSASGTPAQVVPVAIDRLPLASIASSYAQPNHMQGSIGGGHMSSRSHMGSARGAESPFPEEAYIDAGYLDDELDKFELAALLSKVSPHPGDKTHSTRPSPMNAKAPTTTDASYSSAPAGGTIMMYKPNVFDEDELSINSTPRLELPRYPVPAAAAAGTNLHGINKGRAAVKTGGLAMATNATTTSIVPAIRTGGISAASPNKSGINSAKALPIETTNYPHDASDNASVASGFMVAKPVPNINSQHQHQEVARGRQPTPAAVPGSTYAAQGIRPTSRDRFKIDPNILRRNKACVCIQRHARGFLARRRVENYRKRMQRVDQSYCTNCGLKQMGGKYCKKCGRKQDPPPQSQHIISKDRAASKPTHAHNMQMQKQQVPMQLQYDGNKQSSQQNRQMKVEVYSAKQTPVATIWDKRPAPLQDDNEDEEAVEYEYNDRSNRRQQYYDMPQRSGSRGRNIQAQRRDLNHNEAGPMQQPQRNAPQAQNRREIVHRDQQVPMLPHQHHHQQPIMNPSGKAGRQTKPSGAKGGNDSRMTEDIDALERNLERELEALQLLMDQHNHADHDSSVHHQHNGQNKHTDKKSQEAAAKLVAGRNDVKKGGVGNAASESVPERGRPKGTYIQQQQPERPNSELIAPSSHPRSKDQRGTKAIDPPNMRPAQQQKQQQQRPGPLKIAEDNSYFDAIPQPLSPVKDLRRKEGAAQASSNAGPKSPAKAKPPPLPIDILKQQQQQQPLLLPPGSAPQMKSSEISSVRGANENGRGGRQRTDKHGGAMNYYNDPESISLPDISPMNQHIQRGGNAAQHYPHPLDSRRQQQQQLIKSRKESTSSAPHGHYNNSNMPHGGAILDSFDDNEGLGLPSLPKQQQQQSQRRAKK